MARTRRLEHMPFQAQCAFAQAVAPCAIRELALRVFPRWVAAANEVLEATNKVSLLLLRRESGEASRELVDAIADTGVATIEAALALRMSEEASSDAWDWIDSLPLPSCRLARTALRRWLTRFGISPPWMQSVVRATFEDWRDADSAPRQLAGHLRFESVGVGTRATLTLLDRHADSAARHEAVAILRKRFKLAGVADEVFWGAASRACEPQRVKLGYHWVRESSGLVEAVTPLQLDSGMLAQWFRAKLFDALPANPRRTKRGGPSREVVSPDLEHLAASIRPDAVLTHEAIDELAKFVTPRELDLLERLSVGSSIAGASREMGITPSTGRALLYKARSRKMSLKARETLGKIAA